VALTHWTDGDGPR